MRQRNEVDINCEQDGDDWLVENGRVFQGARGKTAAFMTPRHEACHQDMGLFNLPA